MKFTSAVYLTILASTVVGKNVIDLDQFKIDVDSEGNEKREAAPAPKNVFPGIQIEKLNERDEEVDAVMDKREPKNVFPGIQIEKLNEREEGVDAVMIKREPKNVFPGIQIEKLNERDDGVDAVMIKREPKNVFPGIQIEKLNERDDGVDAVMIKREAKNVFKFELLREIDSKKREEQTQIILKNNNNLLQSVIPQVSEISIFGGYIRDNDEISKLTENDSVSTLIIAPSDSAIYNKLNGLKPWEFPRSIDESKDDEHNDKIINKNLNDFLSGHIISNFGDLADGTSRAINSAAISTHLNNGKEIVITQDVTTGSFTLTFEEKTIPVASVREVDNGYLFVINDVLSKP